MKCPRCHVETEKCQTLSSEIREGLLNHQSADAVFSKSCDACLAVLTQYLATPSLIVNKIPAAELKKMVLWRSRGDFVKAALIAMQDYNYEQSLLNYLSYIKILEETFGKPRSEFTAQIFEDLGKSDELPTYIFALWDLIAIYDRELPEQQAEVCKEFAALVKTTTFVTIMARKARIAARTAKNPAIYKQLNKDLGGSKSCFIATAVFGNTYAPEVLIFREFRDQVLEKHILGRALVKVYYVVAPSIGHLIQTNSHLAKALKPYLQMLAGRLSANSFDIYTDGSLKQSTGSWAYVILQKNRAILEGSGRVKGTTSLRMEIQAAIEGLKKTPKQSQINLFSDSRVMIEIVQTKMSKWKALGWVKKTGKQIPDREQIQLLSDLIADRRVTCTWIPAHRGIKYNERCDELCLLARAVGGATHRDLSI